MGNAAPSPPDNWAAIVARHALLDKLRPWLTGATVIVLLLTMGTLWRGANMLGPALEEIGVSLPTIGIIALSPALPTAFIVLVLAVMVKDLLVRNPVVALALNFLALCLGYVLLTLIIGSLFLPFISLFSQLKGP